MARPKYIYKYEGDKKGLYENNLRKKGEKSNYRYALRVLDEVENKNNTPFYELSKQQLENHFKELNSSKSIAPIFSCLDKYAEWYSRGYLNGRLESRYFSKSLNKNEIIEHVELYSDIEKLCKDSNQFYDLLNNTNCVPLGKAIAVLLYIGLNRQDIINLRNDWIDLENGIIKLPNRIFKNISEPFMSFIKESFIFDQKIKKEKLKLLDEIYFLKRKKSNSNRTDALIIVCIRNFAEGIKNKEIKYCRNATDISLSGLYNYLISLEYHNGKCFGSKEIAHKKAIFRGEYIEDKAKDSINSDAPNRKNEYEKFKEYNKTKNDIVFNAAKIIMYPKGNIVERDNSGRENKVGREKIERGEKGEEEVEKVLVKKYGKDNVYKVKDYEGFDFQVTYNSQAIMDIEVKTINNLGGTFYITRNELEKNKNKQNFYLFLVILKKGDERAECIKIIKDPFNKLDINVEELIGCGNNYFKYTNCVVQAESFSIKIKDINKIKFEEIL